MVLSSSLAQNMKLLDQEKSRIKALISSPSFPTIEKVLTPSEKSKLFEIMEHENELRIFREAKVVKLVTLLDGVAKSFPNPEENGVLGILVGLAEKSRENS